MMRREKLRAKEVSRCKKKRDELRAKMKDPNISFEEKMECQFALQKLPRNSSPARTRNRCWETGRANGVYSIVRLCRNKFREYAMNGEVPGIFKSSW